MNANFGKSLPLEAVSATSPVLGTPTVADVSEARAKANSKFDDGTSSAFTNVYAGLNAMYVALDAYKGNSGGANLTKILSQVDTFLAATTCPQMQGGYMGQHELKASAYFVVLKNTPAVWDALGATRRGKIDLIMKGQLFSAACLGSTRYALLDARNMRGRDGAYLTVNANIRHGHSYGLAVAICYFGVAKADSLLAGYSTGYHKSLLSDLASAGLTNLRNTFNWAVDNPGDGAPTVAQISAALITSGNSRWTFAGTAFHIEDWEDILARELPFAWDRAAEVGASNGKGLRRPDYPATKVADAALGRGTMINASGYIPAAGAKEFRCFNAQDAGGPRYCWEYSRWNASNQLNLFAALIASGMVTKNTPFLTGALMRDCDTAFYDLRKKLIGGYKSHAQGGKAELGGGSGANNRDMTIAAYGNEWGANYNENFWFDVLRPWFVTAGKLSAPGTGYGHYKFVY